MGGRRSRAARRARGPSAPGALAALDAAVQIPPHDFVVVGERDEFESEPLASTDPLWGSQTMTIDPGESTLIEFTPEAPGKYFYLCSLFTHMSGHGMWGRFVVE